MNIVIVESPTKTKSLKRYLGADYELVSTKGHVRDLPKSKLGIDVEDEFAPDYVVLKGKKSLLADLQKESRRAQKVFLATDPDREGEAIAWHTLVGMGVATDEMLTHPESSSVKESFHKFKRVVFHEITPTAIKAAFANPRSLDLNLIQAQQARRALDRLVGYKLSPLLWKKIQYGLSAGRVQSVALRMVVEREREREAFQPKIYYEIVARLSTAKAEEFRARLVRVCGKPVYQQHTLSLFAGPYSYQSTLLDDQAKADELIKALSKEELRVAEVKKKKLSRSPQPPFNTASLQRVAGSKLSVSANQVMRLAQRLYEEGLITYHRTDSTYLATSAVGKMRDQIKKEFGQAYLPDQPRLYKTRSKVAQEAHEAIRPTQMARLTEQQQEIEQKMSHAESKLFELIYRRTLASQMRDALYEVTQAKIAAGQHQLQAQGSYLEFAGYLKVYPSEEKERLELPALRKDETVSLVKALSTEHKTAPPPRYNEGSLIKDLEKFGIGRPSTYAPIISTIQDRRYVSKKDGRCLVPEDVGLITSDLLVKHFPRVVDLKFTAQMEDKLDEMANGHLQYIKVLSEFYRPFIKLVEEKEQVLRREDFKVIERTEEKCPQCNAYLIIKLGRYGRFYSCELFPECKYARPFVNKIGMVCPECKKGDVVEKRTRRGRVFYGCSHYPKCEYATWNDPTKAKDDS